MALGPNLTLSASFDARGFRHFVPFIWRALVVTVGLFLLMHLMIYREAPELPEETRRVADIVMEDIEIITNVDDRLPDKPDDANEEPPEPELPEIEQIEFDENFDASLQNAGINVGLSRGFNSDGEYLPIVKVAPIYPRSAQTRGIEGYCVVRYTVTITGATRDPEVVDCSHNVFVRSSLRASLKFKYKPRVIDGEPVEVPGVLNRFTFELEN